MGLYYSQRKKYQQLSTQPQQPTFPTATFDPTIKPSDIDVRMQGDNYWQQRQPEVDAEKLKMSDPVEAQKPIEERQQSIEAKGGKLIVDPETGQERYFVDSPVAPIGGKAWDDMNWLEKFVATGDEAGAMGKSMAGNVALGGTSMALAATGGVMRQIEKINTLGQVQKIQDAFGIDRSGAQILMDWSNKVAEYQQKEFGTASYKPEDITFKNIPKLLANPEFVLNSLSSMTMTGLAWSSGGMPALYAIESGGLLTEKRAEALLKGEKEATNGEVLYSMGMGFFNAWLENFSFKVMSGTTKVPFTDALLKKISNRMVRNITSWGAKVATEMGEEFIQEGLPILVSEVIFKEKDDIRSAFQRAKDALPEAVTTGKRAAIMALPGAAVMSGFGVSQENAVANQEAQTQTEQKVAGTMEGLKGEQLAEFFNQSMSDFQTMETALQDATIAEGMETKLIENGKLNTKIQERVTNDLLYKINKASGNNTADAKILDNFVKAGLKGQTFNNYQEYIGTVKGLIEQSIAPSQAKIFNDKIMEQGKTYRGEGGEAQAAAREIGAEGVFGEGLYLAGNEKTAEIFAGEKGDVSNKYIKPGAKTLKIETQAELNTLQTDALKYAKTQGVAAKDLNANKLMADYARSEGYQVLDATKLDDTIGKFILDPKVVQESKTSDMIENRLGKEQEIKIKDDAKQKSLDKTAKIKSEAATTTNENVVLGEKSEGTGIIREKVVPKEDLKYIYAEAEKEGITNTIAEAITKPISEPTIASLNERQKAVAVTALSGIASAEGMSEGAIIQNIEALGGTPPISQRQTNVGGGESQIQNVGGTQTVAAQTEPIKEVTTKNVETAINSLSKMDEDARTAETNRRSEVATTRENMRIKIAEALKKDAQTFIDVKAGKDKASPFTVSVKKLPNGKYGYAITMNTPSSSQAINYNPKFATKEKAMRMGIQRAVRMMEEARQTGAPIVGLAKMKSAVMAANRSLGKEALPAKRIKRAVAETKRKIAEKAKENKYGTDIDIVKGVKTYYKNENGKVVIRDEDNNLILAKENTLAKAVKKAKYNIDHLSIKELKENSKKLAGETEKAVIGAQRAYASGGNFSDVKSYQKHISQFKHVEMPELLGITKKLLGSTPKVRNIRARKYMSVAGMFKPGSMEIILTPSLFENEGAAGKTLAHELGHLTDYLPDKTMSRGNILGRIGSLRSFLRHTFTDVETESKIDSLIAERKNLQQQRRDTNSPRIDKELLTRLKAVNKQIKELQANAIKKDGVFEELWNLSQLWKPIGENASEQYLQYRKSSEELYADAISVLFNDPALLEQEAPIFYKAFFKNLDQKPEAKQVFYDTWELLNKGEGAVLSERQKNIYEMFEKSEDVFKIKREEKIKGETDMLFRFKYEFIDKNQRMIDKVRKAMKEGKKISGDANPIYQFEEHNYLGGVIKNFVETKIQPIRDALANNDLTWEDLGAVLMLERAKGERGEMANPGGFSPETSQKQLDFMKEEMGEEKFTALKSQVNKFREVMKEEVLAKAEDAGIYTPELIEQMKANDTYATFQVIDYLDVNIPASIRQQVGTLADVANPATSTVMKAVSILRAAETNTVKRSFVDFLKTEDTENIKPARTTYTGKYHKPMESKEPNEALFTLLEEGKIKGYYVDPYIAGVFDRVSTATSKGFLLPALKFVNKKISRPLLIQYNPGFQAFNLIRDFSRFWKNIPGMTLFKAVKLYKKAIPASKNRAIGKLDPLISEMEGNKLLSVTYNEFISGQETIDQQIDYVMEKAGITPTTPEATNKFLKPFVKILNFIDETGQAVETLPKVAAYMHFQENQNIFESEEELGSFIRTSVGSPDFLRQNAGYNWTNDVFLFSNAIKEAIRADASVMVNPKTRNGYWAKTATSNLAPKLLMAAAAFGLLGEPLKEMFKNVSEYDKTNYIIIPVGVDKNGKTAYLRIPQDETGRFIGGLFWKMMTAGTNETPLSTDLLQMFAYTGGQLPGVAPAIDTVVAAGQFATGRNPYDFFRGRTIIPDEQFTAGGKEALKPFVLWSLQNLGANVVFNFSITEQSPVSKTWGEKLLSLPLVSNVVGRWIRISDYGQIETARSINAQVNKENAQRRIDWKKEINDSVEKYNSGDKSVARANQIKQQLVYNLLKDEGTKVQETYIKKKFDEGITRANSDAKVKAIMSASTNAAKIEVLKGYKAAMSPSEFDEFLGGLLNDKIISKTVYNEFN